MNSVQAFVDRSQQHTGWKDTADALWRLQTIEHHLDPDPSEIDALAMRF